MRKKKSSSESESDQQVEELLRAAQDDLLLKLSLNSHTTRSSSSSDLHPDLSRRFQALKSPTSLPSAPPPQSQPPPRPPSQNQTPPSSSAQVDDELKAVLGDDLSARFAALKGSLYPSSASDAVDHSVSSDGRDRRDIVDLGNVGGEEEDDVEKLIQWAVDAARLDPSPPYDDEADDDVDDSDRDDSDEEDELRKKKKKNTK